jgi:predicted ArsR family transcriptional regulator
MDDQFLKLFAWITPLLQRDVADLFKSGSPEQALLEEFRKGWGRGDTGELLRELAEKYGPIAAPAIEHFVASCVKEEWSKIGRVEAHPGNEIHDFIRVLWEPLEAEGFSFTRKETEGQVRLCVTRCPVHDLAERTGMHAWLYHLACAMDFYTTSAFSAEIGFSRTKTLMEGHECCDHTYFCRSE